MPSQKVPGRPGGNISRFERPGDPSQRNTQVRHMAPPRAAYDREEKRVFPYWTIPVVLVCVGLVSLLSWLAAREYEVYRQFQNVSRQVATGTLYPGISVNGVDVGGMTLEEATAALETNTQQQGEAFAIGIAYGEAAMFTLDSNVVHHKKMQIRASDAVPALYFPLCIDLVESGQIDLKSLISHTFPLENAIEGLKDFIDHPADGVKAVMVQP